MSDKVQINITEIAAQGFTAIFSYPTVTLADGSTAVLQKVDGYVGGVGEVPDALKANIGKYAAKAGGYTEDVNAASVMPVARLSNSFNPTSTDKAETGKSIADELGIIPKRENRVVLNVPSSVLTIDSKAVDSFGNQVSVAGYSLSEFIKLDNWSEIIFNNISAAPNNAVIIYDANLKFLKIYRSTGRIIKEDFPDAYYYRVAWESSKISEISVRVITEPFPDNYEQELYVQAWYKRLGYNVEYVPFNRETFPRVGIINNIGNLDWYPQYRSTDAYELPSNWEFLEAIIPAATATSIMLYALDKGNIKPFAPKVANNFLITIKRSEYPDASFFDMSWSDEFPPLLCRIITRANEAVITESDTKIRQLENRLFNPMMDSFEEYNKRNPSEPIVNDIVFTASDLPARAISRIPAVLVTNAGTLLAATERREAQEDSGVMDLLLKRKTKGGNWKATSLFTSSPSTYARIMNPAFVYDKMGAHGVTGRIFLFAYAMKNPNKFIMESSSEETDCIYRYSDDDGATWSSWISIKSGWDLTKYRSMGVGPHNGIQTRDGSLMIPAMSVSTKQDLWFSGVIYKKPDSEWKFSSNSMRRWDTEAVLFERGRQIVMNTRFENAPYLRSAYIFDADTGNFKRDISDFTLQTYHPCQMSIIKTTIYGQMVYLMTYPDYYGDPVLFDNRKNLTLFASLDAIKWIKVYRISDKDVRLNGYSMLDENNGKLVVIYEKNLTEIAIQDLEKVKPLIARAVNVELNVNLEDRIQAFLIKK